MALLSLSLSLSLSVCLSLSLPLSHCKVSTTLAIEAVDISALKDYNGWYHHQILAARDCYSRSVAAGVAWALFMDVDEVSCQSVWFFYGGGHLAPAPRTSYGFVIEEQPPPSQSCPCAASHI